jgi:hypothetical protein
MRQIIERHGADAAVDTAPARTLDDHARQHAWLNSCGER